MEKEEEQRCHKRSASSHQSEENEFSPPCLTDGLDSVGES